MPFDWRPMMSNHHRHRLLPACVHLLIPGLKHRLPHQLGFAGDDLVDQAQRVGMIGYREPGERVQEFDQLSA